MKKVLKIILIIILAVAVLIAGFIGLLYYGIYFAKSVPKDYTSTVQTGGDIEAKYLAMGSYSVKSYKEKTDKPADQYLFYYPAELEQSDRTYPVVVVANGTGVFANKSSHYLEHLASWGFIVLDNYDPSTYSGESAEQTLSHLLDLNEDTDSIFYQKVDVENIGITGHSQGGIGVFNAVQNWTHSNLFTCAISISPTEEATANLIGMTYTSAKTTVPMFLLAGTENDVISAEKLIEMYDGFSVPKVMAVRQNTNHGEMLYSADGYATAWFMWLLQGDQEAAKAFVGENPEILDNAMYQNIVINLD